MSFHVDQKYTVQRDEYFNVSSKVKRDTFEAADSEEILKKADD